MNMQNLIIIQHCQSEHHINELSGGWTDTPLTSLGREQARKIGQRLLNEINSTEYKLFASDLLRASQTAEIIGALTGLTPILDSKIRERNFGVATGKTKKWFSKNVDLSKIYIYRRKSPITLT